MGIQPYLQKGYLDDKSAAAHALEGAAGVAHAQYGLQLCGSRRASHKAQLVPALDEDCHSPVPMGIAQATSIPQYSERDLKACKLALPYPCCAKLMQAIIIICITLRILQHQACLRCEIYHSSCLQTQAADKKLDSGKVMSNLKHAAPEPEEAQPVNSCVSPGLDHSKSSILNGLPLSKQACGIRSVPSILSPAPANGA